MQLARPRPARSLISLVSMIDVLMIMLVFFMVTSTYLDLDMIPLAERADPSQESDTNETVQQESASGQSILIRLAADGAPYVSGQRMDQDGLIARLAGMPDASVVILPSGQAETQALVSLIDVLNSAGVSQVRLVRLEARP